MSQRTLHHFGTSTQLLIPHQDDLQLQHATHTHLADALLLRISPHTSVTLLCDIQDKLRCNARITSSTFAVHWFTATARARETCVQRPSRYCLLPVFSGSKRPLIPWQIVAEWCSFVGVGCWLSWVIIKLQEMQTKARQIHMESRWLLKLPPVVRMSISICCSVMGDDLSIATPSTGQATSNS